jgi:hypothetical protein
MTSLSLWQLVETAFGLAGARRRAKEAGTLGSRAGAKVTTNDGYSPWRLDQKLSRQNRRHRPASADQRGNQIGMAIRRKHLHALQQHRESHEGPPDHERPRPSKAEDERDHEIAKEMINSPTESRPWYPFAGAKGGKYQQEQNGHAANF